MSQACGKLAACVKIVPCKSAFIRAALLNYFARFSCFVQLERAKHLCGPLSVSVSEQPGEQPGLTKIVGVKFSRLRFLNP